MKKLENVAQPQRYWSGFFISLVEHERLCWFLFAALAVILTLHVNGIDVLPRFSTAQAASATPTSTTRIP